jgi:hypothetical protein
MSIRDTSLAALEQSGDRLGRDQQIIFDAFCALGPMHDNRILEYLRQGEIKKNRDQRRKNPWETRDVTGRRNQLMKKCQIGNEGMIVDRGSFHGWCNGMIKKYHFWAVRNDTRPVPAGWYSNIEDVPGYKKSSNGGGCEARKKIMAETLF